MGGIPNYLHQFVTVVCVCLNKMCVFIQYFPQHSVGKNNQVERKGIHSQYMIVTNVLVDLI